MVVKKAFRRRIFGKKRPKLLHKIPTEEPFFLKVDMKSQSKTHFKTLRLFKKTMN